MSEPNDDTLLIGPHIGANYRGYNMPDGSIHFGDEEIARAAWMAYMLNRLSDIERKLDAVMRVLKVRLRSRQ